MRIINYEEDGDPVFVPADLIAWSLIQGNIKKDERYIAESDFNKLIKGVKNAKRQKK